MAIMLVAAMRERHRTLACAVMEGEPADAIQRRVREIAVEAMARVAAAFPDLDRRRPPDPVEGSGGRRGSS